MICNLHTHTWRCNHASGTEREYVENGLAAGLEILGFSDHSPYVFPDGYYSHFRMRMDQVEDYVRTVLALRQQYAGRIQVPLGLEIEYYPAHFGELLAILRDHPMDYLILGQHFVGNEYDAPYNGTSCYDEGLLRRYVDQSIDAMQTGLFTYFAHPDLLNFRGDPEKYRREMRRICIEAKGCGIPLELNLLGVFEGKHYPNRPFWELAAEEGCQVVLGRDAHAPEMLLDQHTEEQAMNLVRQLGLDLITKAELRSIK